MGVKKMLRSACGKMMGTTKMYAFWNRMYNFSLMGMNIGNGGSPATSGENNVLKFALKNSISTESMVVYDCGANKGQYSLNAHKVITENGGGYHYTLLNREKLHFRS